MNMPATDLNDSAVLALAASWGFDGGAISPQLLEHALNVLNLRKRKVGEIVVSLGIASQQAVDVLVSSKPDEEKTLDWLRHNIQDIAPRYDEVMAIHLGLPFISQIYAGLQVHPLLAKKDVFQKIESDLARWNVLPMQINGSTTMLLFGDMQKMLRFDTLGRNEKRQSPLLMALASELKQPRVDELHIKCAAADNGVLIYYRQQMEDVAEGKTSASESLQIITEQDGEGNPTAAKAISILNEAIKLRINDVEIAPDKKNGSSRVFFRRNQRLRNSGIVLAGAEKDEVVRFLLARSGANKGAGRLMAPADGNSLFIGKMGQAFLRLSFIPLESSNGEAISVSVRVLPRTVQKIKMGDLNIPAEIQAELKRFIRRKYGLVIVCGPTGSGKSTTIAGMICEHEELYGDSLKRLSVEDPCERILPGVLHIDVSQHTYRGDKEEQQNKFAMALRAILRHDPDLIFVGEVRDKEACTVSVDSANTGHLVFTTTHANDPVLGYRRMAGFLNADRRFDLVNVLEAIVAQRLVTTVCPHCSVETEMDDESVEDMLHYCRSKGIVLERNELPNVYRKAKPTGCNKCLDGYDGMIPIHGLLTMNPEVRALLLSSDERDWMRAQNASDSKHTLFNAAFQLFKSGKVDLDTVML
ncbi:hypothetical protein AX279_18340 [Pseudomonas sp. J237]|nr:MULTISPECIES: ATPase, T2SS/T4P/T4SS family [Pseudomonas]OEO24626.1 hypothetical protein AX279_18340 [Pseudomonas sp. J237]CRN72560.1 Type II traffic warden ATPase [Pseudomonas aeruginosa]